MVVSAGGRMMGLSAWRTSTGITVGWHVGLIKLALTIRRETAMASLLWKWSTRRGTIYLCFVVIGFDVGDGDDGAERELVMVNELGMDWEVGNWACVMEMRWVIGLVFGE
ncbi:Hypothetical predicted protein [Olea europaea subsp. europaea]|uniref:Uncharacterized protein n=1 Tax=Olea europaea subsp. europaea TaxID=158383 RepID=A0A8S0STJ5_OLEEU|nr:Hypothetical predicted protein [Olea europaea subsp. europaea]